MNRLTVCSFHAIELYQKYNNYDPVTGRQRQTGSVYKCQRIKKERKKKAVKEPPSVWWTHRYCFISPFPSIKEFDYIDCRSVKSLPCYDFCCLRVGWKFEFRLRASQAIYGFFASEHRGGKIEKWMRGVGGKREREKKRGKAHHSCGGPVVFRLLPGREAPTDPSPRPPNLLFFCVLITRSERLCHGCGAESQPAAVLPPQLLIQLDLIRFHLSY